MSGEVQTGLRHQERCLALAKMVAPRSSLSKRASPPAQKLLPAQRGEPFTQKSHRLVALWRVLRPSKGAETFYLTYQVRQFDDVFMLFFKPLNNLFLYSLQVYHTSVEIELAHGFRGVNVKPLEILLGKSPKLIRWFECPFQHREL